MNLSAKGECKQCHCEQTAGAKDIIYCRSPEIYLLKWAKMVVEEEELCMGMSLRSHLRLKNAFIVADIVHDAKPNAEEACIFLKCGS